MATIKPNCRERLTAPDFEFIASSLAGEAAVSPSLTSLLRDASAMNVMLDNDRLLKSLLESPSTIAVTPQLYFYVLVRRMLREFDREVADYIAGVLAAFVDIRRLRSSPDQPGINLDYISDMLIALKSASTEREFQIRVHVGNYSLFLSGVFPQRIQQRASRRGAPEIAFYDEVGSTNYRMAANHRLAQQHALGDIYRTIGDHFTEVRVGLNRMSDRLLCLEPLWSADA